MSLKQPTYPHPHIDYSSDQMSQPFSSGPSPASSNGHAPSSAPDPYHPALPNFSAFPGLSTFAQVRPQMPLATPAQENLSNQPQRSPSSGNSDLEKLERLKKEILEGQNPIYKAIPQPNFLESLYLGRSMQASSSAPAHPEQIPTVQSASDNVHSSSSPSADGEAISGEYEQSAPTNYSRQSQHAGAKAQISNNVNGTITSSSTSGVPRRSRLTPKFEQDISQVDQNILRASSQLMVDASRLSSKETVDSTMEHEYPNPAASLSASDNARPQATASMDSSSFLEKSVSSKDPPYNPRESLRPPRERPVSNDGMGPVHGLVSFDSHYGQSFDGSRNDQQERNYDRDWSLSYGCWSDGQCGISERRFAVSNSDSKAPPHFQDFKSEDNVHLQEDRRNDDFRRLAGGFTGRSLREADDFTPRGPVSGQQQSYAVSADNHTKALNDVASAWLVPHLAANSSANPQSATTDDGLTRRPPLSTRLQSVDEPSSHSTQAVAGEKSMITASPDKRSAAGSPPALQERIGIHIPLEERVSSSPIEMPTHASPTLHGSKVDLSFSEQRPAGSFSSDMPSSSSAEVARRGDIRTIPTPLSLVRMRPADGRLSSSSPTSATGSAQVLSRERNPNIASSPGDATERAEGSLQSLYPVYAHGSHPPNNHLRATVKEEYILRQSVPDGPDSKVDTSAIRRENERYAVEGRSLGNAGYYERPVPRVRDPAPIDDRTSSSFDGREWRGGYPKDYPSRSEAKAFPGSAPRIWSTNSRGRRPTGPELDERNGYLEYERRPIVTPRSWDRDDADRSRPVRAVYPSPNDSDRERYAPNDYRDSPRVRGRSPSPTPARRMDMRPAKRVRDEAYYDGRDRRYMEYQAQPAPPPPPMPLGSFYDEGGPYPPRDVHDGYPERNKAFDVAYYDRTTGSPRSPPYMGRAIYSRPDLDRYNAAPPRTA